MKQAKEIIEHLFTASSDKLSKSRFFLKAVEIMPQNLANELLFCYIKDGTLFFVTKNRSMVFELNYKLKSLKEALLFLAQHGDFEDFKNFQEIKVFATRYETTFVTRQNTQVGYMENERAVGNFKNSTSDDKLSSIFEEIRKLIKNH